MKPLLLLTLAPIGLCISASTHVGERIPAGSLAGTYGVCGCAEDAPSATRIALTISEDGSYTYVDSSDPSHPMDEHGQWRMDGRKLNLRSAMNEQVWTLDKDQPCVRARFGMRFERLCRLKECD